MSRAAAPSEAIDVIDGRRALEVRTAIADAINPDCYEPVPLGEDRYYLAALAPLEAITADDEDEFVAIYATEDGAYLKTLRKTSPPHAVHGLRLYKRQTSRLLGRRAVAALSEIVARAHPEVDQ